MLPVYASYQIACPDLQGFCLNTVSAILPPTFELATQTPSWYAHVDEYVEMVPAAVSAERCHIMRFELRCLLLFLWLLTRT